MKTTCLLCLALAFVAAPALSAQTIEQTVTFNASNTFTAVSGPVQHVDATYFVGTFDPFDSSLGTLDSFVIEWSLENTATGNFGAAGGTISMSIVGSLTLNGSAYRNGIVGANGTGGPPFGAIALSAPIAETDLFLSSEAGINYDSAFLTAVTGSGTFTLGFTAPVNLSVSGQATFDALSSGNVKLTYHYTAIPEPSTYAALLGALALGLAAIRRRR